MVYDNLFSVINCFVWEDGDDVVQREVRDPGEGGGGVVWVGVQGAQQGEQVDGGDKKVQIIGQSGAAD